MSRLSRPEIPAPVAARHARKAPIAAAGLLFASNGSARERRSSADCLASAAAAFC